MRSWTNHINGASAIARLRGTAQLRTKIGRTIFAILRIQIVSYLRCDRWIFLPDGCDIASRLHAKNYNGPSISQRLG